MNTPVELRNITNDTGKSPCMTKFNAYLRHDQVHLTLPSDINWSTVRIVELQDANANFLLSIRQMEISRSILNCTEEANSDQLPYNITNIRCILLYIATEIEAIV
jgi:hypothetical protein